MSKASKKGRGASQQAPVGQDGEDEETNATLLEVPAAYKEQLREAFDMFDDTGKGYIESQEAIVALYALGYNLSRSDVQLLLHDAGVIAPDSIDFNEFYRMLVLQMTKPQTKGETVRAFKQMDAAEKGCIDLGDLRAMAASLRMEMTDSELEEMVEFARSVGTRAAAQGQSEFDAKDTLTVTEVDYVRLMKQINGF